MVIEKESKIAIGEEVNRVAVEEGSGTGTKEANVKE